MSKGFLIFAENLDGVDYVKQAYALAMSIKSTQQDIKSVALITNDDLIPEEYKSVFDHIVSIPWYNQPGGKYSAEHRWKLYHATPYEETIVLDADMLFLEDVSDWWEYCSKFDLKFCSHIRNYKREIIKQDSYHRRAFIDNKLTNPYFALHYFRKSDSAFNFYKTLEFIVNNWEWCYTKFAPISYQNWLSMDLATAIAIEITGYYDSVIDDCCPLEFVHMKPAIQGWPLLYSSWQDAIPFVLNSSGDLVVGNIKQPKLFHYVEKTFLSDRIIDKLKEIYSG